jgi:hypothetical protein
MKNIQNFNLKTVHNPNDWEAFLLEAPEKYYGRDRYPENALAKMVIAGLNYEHRTNDRDAEKGINLPEYTGRFSVRVNQDLHINLAREAQRRGISLNALIVQKLSRDFEKEEPLIQWSLDNVIYKINDIVFELQEVTSKRSVHIVFDRNNIADTLGNDYAYDNQEKLLPFIQAPDNHVLHALNKFLTSTSILNHVNKLEINCRLVVVKSDKPINSVLVALKRFLEYGENPNNISATDALTEWDDYLVLEN